MACTGDILSTGTSINRNELQQIIEKKQGRDLSPMCVPILFDEGGQLVETYDTLSDRLMVILPTAPAMTDEASAGSRANMKV